MDMMWGMGGMMFATALLWLVVVSALAAGVWWLLRAARPASGDRASETLRERYARGEISREEFEARRRDLGA